MRDFAHFQHKEEHNVKSAKRSEANDMSDGEGKDQQEGTMSKSAGVRKDGLEYTVAGEAKVQGK